MTSLTPPIRNPAPHRGFSTKAREVLLDSPKVSSIQRVGSDEEFLRKVSAMRDKFNRSDSDETGLGFSHINLNKPFHAVDRRLNFDELKEKKFDGRKVAASPFKHRLLGEIGKTRSAGDLLSPWKRNDIQINAPNTTKLPRAKEPLCCADDDFN